jgi:hypothetical protein
VTDNQEWRLKQLEEEIRHEKEMRALQGARIDTHQDWLLSINATLDTVGARLNLISEMQKQTEAMLQNLIQALAREHKNGKGTE